MDDVQLKKCSSSVDPKFQLNVLESEITTPLVLSSPVHITEESTFCSVTVELPPPRQGAILAALLET